MLPRPIGLLSALRFARVPTGGPVVPFDPFDLPLDSPINLILDGFGNLFLVSYNPSIVDLTRIK